MKYYKLCCMLLSAMIFSQIGVCQDGLLEIKWEEEEEFFFPGKLHRVTCAYTSSVDQKIKLILKPDPILKLLSPTSYKISAEQEVESLSTAKIYLPQVDTKDKSNLSIEVIVQSLEDDQKVLARQVVSYAIKERIVVRIEALKTQIPIKDTDSLVTIPIRIKNLGKSKQDVKLVLQKKPEGLSMNEMQKNIRIKPSKDTVVRFAVEPERNWNKVHSAAMKYELFLKENNEKIADCRVFAFPMGKTKKYFNPRLRNNNKHTLKLGLQNRGKNNNALDYYGTGITPFLEGNISYQAQSFYYTLENKFELVNTNLTYHGLSKSIHFGQINYNDEAYLSGRGVIYESEVDSHAFHLGFINGTQSLFSSDPGLQTLTGNSFIGGFSKPNNQFGTISGNGLLKFREDSKTGLLWFSNSINRVRTLFNIRVGFSAVQNTNQSNTFKPGMGLNFEYEKRINSWVFKSNGFYSSPQYEGSTPGNISTSNKVTFLGWKNFRFSTSARIRKSSSSVQKEDQQLIRNSTSHNYQIQLETKSLGNWKVSLAPYQLFETRNFINFSNPEQYYNSTSTRIRTAIHRKKGSLILGLTNDLGYYTFGYNSQNQVSSLTYNFIFNLSTRYLTINSGYKKGTANLSNAFRDNKLDQTNSDFHLSTRWGKLMFNGKIKTNLSNQISYNNIRKLWTSVSLVSIQSIFAKNLTVNTEFSFFNTLYSNSQFWRIKLVKNINNYRSPERAKKLKLTLFEDTNNNGQLDNSEKTLTGIFVKVNEVTLVSGNEGWVNYKGLPAGEYSLSFVDPTGAFAGKRKNINLTEDIIQDIPFYKTIPVRGKVKELKQRFKKSKFTLLGMPILAKNIQGEIITTYTQDDGSFFFNLPKNEYVIYIDEKAFGDSFEFSDNFQKIQVEGKDMPVLNFSVKVKSRKMTIKKF